MTTKSVEIYLRFIRYYLNCVIDICKRANHAQVQLDIIELYIKAALSLVDEMSFGTEPDKSQNVTKNKI